MPAIPAQAWIHDPRIRAAVICAPALGFTFGKPGLARVQIPIQLWRADQDEILPQPFYAQAVCDDLPNSPDYHTIPAAGHMDFLSPCNAAKTHILPDLCHSQTGFNRTTFHAIFNTQLVAFLTAKLR